MTTIGVVGGGAAGTMVVTHLARTWDARQPLSIVVYDTSARPARGVAYSTTEPHHLLNVPAGRMSAVHDDDGHFLHWLRSRDAKSTAEDFRPRCEYGDYLADTLADHAAAVRLVVRRCQVIGVSRAGAGVRIEHADGADRVDAVVLALGHAPPARPPAVVAPESAGYVADPWAPGAL
ncbi:MAG: hypothetical protein QOJ03_1503, partial [Frankiaceae bacterium]|nr:hypothetical protein [Frankiaceae bacterium]